MPKLTRRAFSTLFDDAVLDITERQKQQFRGSLIIVPTPLGNLGDLSLRQFEALTSAADIIACEDTRKTGKLLELILDRKVKGKFKSAFGTDFETFFDSDKNIKPDPDSQAPVEEEILFTNSVDDIVLTQLQQANDQIDKLSDQPTKVFEVLQVLEQELLLNKSIDYQSDANLMAKLTEEDRKFVQEIDQEYYTRVRSSETYYRRKSLILQNLQILQAKVEGQAKTHDDWQKLKFILIEKAKQKKSIVKSFMRKETDQSESVGYDQDDFDLLYGLENEQTKETKDKIRESKMKKGRGLLLSFYEFNQELRVPRLIRAMKMGFRVALVSDAGTPTISDPGFKLTKAAHDEGIAVESLPGPCAVTTALSACGFPTEKFSFMGYIPKTDADKVELFQRAAATSQTTVFYDSPNRITKSLAAISEVMGPTQEVFIGIEMTKMHEAYHRGSVTKVLDILNEIVEDGKLKGEITLVVAPCADLESTLNQEAKGYGFDIQKDSQISVSMLTVAQTLYKQVDTSEHELRVLLKKIFTTVPSYHINAVARLTVKGTKEGKFEALTRRSGGITI